MQFLNLLKLLPALIGLGTKLFGQAKTPPKRVEDVLGGPATDTKSEAARKAAEAAANEKFGS